MWPLACTMRSFIWQLAQLPAHWIPARCLLAEVIACAKGLLSAHKSSLCIRAVHRQSPLDRDRGGRRIQICSELYIPMEASPRRGKTAFSAGAPGTDAAGGHPLTRRPITCQFTPQHRVYSLFMRSAKRPRFTLMEDASPNGTIAALPRLNEWSPDGCGSPHLAVLSRDGCWSPLSTPCWVTVANTEAASRWVSSRCQAPCSEGVAARAVKQFHSTLRGEPQIRLGAAPIPDNIARSIHRPRAASRSEAQWEPYD